MNENNGYNPNPNEQYDNSYYDRYNGGNQVDNQPYYNQNAYNQPDYSANNNQYSDQYAQYNQPRGGSQSNQNGVNYSSTPAAPSNNGEAGKEFAVASLVLGIISLVCCGGIVNAVIGLIFGIISKKRKPQNNGMAIAGIIISAITICVWLILTIVFYGSISYMVNQVLRLAQSGGRYYY